MNPSDRFLIRRTEKKTRASTETICSPRELTILIDEADDAVLDSYRRALLGEKDESLNFEFLLNSQAIALKTQSMIGFGESFPMDDTKLEAFLLSAGYQAQEIAELIRQYDLEQQRYLPCGALNATVSRQLHLLKALRSKSPILLLNDPFMPFSGRWREHFGELLLREAQESGRIIVILNLSFPPTAWTKHTSIVRVDVGKAAEKAQEHAKAQAAMAQELQKIREQENQKNTEIKNPQVPSSIAPNSGQTEIELPESFAYEEILDRYFAPLADLSRFLRSYSTLLVPLGLAGFALLAGLVMYPNMKNNREILKNLPLFQEETRRNSLGEGEEKHDTLPLLGTPKEALQESLQNELPPVSLALRELIPIKTFAFETEATLLQAECFLGDIPQCLSRSSCPQELSLMNEVAQPLS